VGGEGGAHHQMTTYVLRNGQLTEKRRSLREPTSFPSPRVSRFEAYTSPVDDHWVTSDRERERDLARNNAFDTRDLAPDTELSRGRAAQFRELANARSGPEPDDSNFTWGGAPEPA
jgi:hypothetical protein